MVHSRLVPGNLLVGTLLNSFPRIKFFFKRNNNCGLPNIYRHVNSNILNIHIFHCNEKLDRNTHKSSLEGFQYYRRKRLRRSSFSVTTWFIRPEKGCHSRIPHAEWKKKGYHNSFSWFIDFRIQLENSILSHKVTNQVLMFEFLF